MLVSANLCGFTHSVQPLKIFSWTDSNSHQHKYEDFHYLNNSCLIPIQLKTYEGHAFYCKKY